jgi:hypothetical protein
MGGALRNEEFARRATSRSAIESVLSAVDHPQ